MRTITYRGGYRFQLVKDYVVQTVIRPDHQISTMFIDLATNGMLLIRAGYAWDGPSGPTFATKNFMRGSLVHDALYQLMREDHLDSGRWRETADQELVRICKEDGMSALRAWWVFQGVRFGGGPATRPSGGPEIQVAP